MLPRVTAALSALLFVLVTSAGTTLAQGTQPSGSSRSAVVTATTAAIDLDGVLDEAAWTTAPSIGDLVQRQPATGTAPSERTRVILLRDADNLYIGVIAYDSEPRRVLGAQMVRDGSLNADDRIEILLDTFRDQRNAFYFATNPAGALLDGLAFGNGELNNDWDAIWNVGTRRTEEGWTAEFAIPFKSLTFPTDSRAWGFNISRTIQRKLEEDRWTGALLQTRFLQVSEAGQIASLEGARQGLGLDLRPFLAGNHLTLGGDGGSDLRGKPGLDLFYNITSNLKLSTTVNTDFGETEVDARTINLTRFSVLFPEKRSFFLEDAGVFAFASTGPDPAGGIPVTGAEVFPFFTRQIGLLQGREVPLDVGVKLTGRVSRTEIGVLDVRTDDLEVNGRELTSAKNLFIGRIKQNIFQQSYVGAVVTSGNPAQPLSSSTVGADLSLSTSRLMGRPQTLVVNAYALRSINEGLSQKDWSYGFSAQYPNDKYAAQVVVREIQENFRPALGFVQRDNVRLFRAAFSFNPRPRNFLNLQQMFHDFYYTQFTNLSNGRIESADFYMTLLDWHANTGDSWHGILDFQRVYEHLFEPFVISPGVILPMGEYRFTRWTSNLFTTASRRSISGGMTINWGDYWSGTAKGITANTTFRLPPKFTFTLRTNQTFATLPQGNFTARIYTSNINYTWSPRVAFSNLLQYDNRSRNLGWQSRLRWTLRPGDDVYVVLNQGWIQESADEVRFRAGDRKISAKFQYALRL